MNDDLDPRLGAARPHTPADDGWAASADGDRALESIRRAVRDAPRRSRLASIGRLPGRPALLGVGLTAAAAVAVTLALTLPGGAHQPRTPVAGPSGSTPEHLTGARPAAMALVAYDDCGAALSALRTHAAAHVSAYGLNGLNGLLAPVASSSARGAPDAVRAPAAAADGSAAPDHSTTNVQEIGVDEPDVVETDGRRVVSVSAGILRVTDVATHKVTGSLDLTMYAGSDSAQLLMSGDRLLVLLGDSALPYYRGGGAIYDTGPYGPQTSASSGYLLVDLAGDQPSIVSTLHVKGGYLNARMVDGTVRLVVQSVPRIAFPIATTRESRAHLLERDRDAVRHMPLSAWLPTYDITANGETTTHTVPCQDVSHPATYTGASMLTVYTFGLTGQLDDLAPVSLAADGTTVYASSSSLYVVSGGDRTSQIHRFDISGSGRPTYLGSGSVPGSLLDAYSLSEYDGSLRAVTTSGMDAKIASTSVYVLDAATLKISGHVGGLGRQEQVHAVRFLGPLAYVVTFESVDPLYVLDLHDPAHPRRTAALQLTGYSDYLHQTGPGRLLGVGESVNGEAKVAGLQVSLFDVSDSSHPRQLSRVVRNQTPGEGTIDPHAFLYWPATHLAVVPIQSWDSAQSGAVLVLRVGTDGLRTVGIIRNPAVSTQADGYDQGIVRTMVIGASIWTLSSSGLQVSSASDLASQAWIPFS